MSLITSIIKRLWAAVNIRQDVAARTSLLSVAVLFIVGVGYTSAPQTPLAMVTTQPESTAPYTTTASVGSLSRTVAAYRQIGGRRNTLSATGPDRAAAPPKTTVVSDTARSTNASDDSTVDSTSTAGNVPTPAKPKTEPAPPPPPPGPAVLTSNTNNLNPLLLQRFDAFRSFIWSKFGETVEIRSGWRSSEEQAQLFRTLPAGYANPPGHSQHEKGNAIDYTPYKPEFNQYLGMFGLKLPYSWKEQWHIEVVEPH